MPTYRNKTDQDHAVPGVGVVKAGETVTTDQVIENSNFEETTPQTKPSAPEKASSEQSASEKSDKKEDTK